ncbi:MAG: phage protein Gp27 family protein [Eubacteriales bacterium]|nr:phage protein Gp27 family protein [Eubacteriales bacterium]
MGKNRRKHFKVEGLPDGILEVVNRKLVDGFTYEQITEWVNGLGHDISKSAIGRYGKDFTSRLQRLQVVKDQAKAIVDVSPDAPATEMAEAANQLATQLIMELLMDLDLDDLRGAKITEILKALAKLEASGVRREKLKFDFNKGVDAAAARIKEALRAEVNSDPDLMSKLSAIVDRQAKEARK